MRGVPGPEVVDFAAFSPELNLASIPAYQNITAGPQIVILDQIEDLGMTVVPR